MTSAETIAEFLTRSKRKFVPIRTSFLQQGSGKIRTPGPLSSLVHRGDARGLDLYLLIHAAASSPPFDVNRAASTWARALDLPQHPRSKSHLSTVSKVLRRLEERKLIARVRRKGRSQIFLLDEGGGGEAYERPKSKSQLYLKLPHQYWTDEWHKRLNLPAKFVLLVALSLKDEFVLPIERGPDWYGVSADTLQRGLKQLQDVKLLSMFKGYKKAPLAPRGYTVDQHYTLASPFEPLRKTTASIIALTGT